MLVTNRYQASSVHVGLKCLQKCNFDMVSLVGTSIDISGSVLVALRGVAVRATKACIGCTASCACARCL